MSSRRRTGVAAIAGLTLLLTGCGAAGRGGPGQPAARPAPVLAAQSDARSIVFTAEMTVRVDDARRATGDATRIVTAADGFVSASKSNLGGHRAATHLTVKVPPDRFDPVLTALGDLGHPLARQVKAEDVTEQVVDLDGRLQASQASAARLRTLLDGAASAADVAALEGELAKREGDIESLAGRLRVLTSQVELATIDVTLTEQATLTLTRDVPGFARATRTGFVVLANLALVTAAAVGFVLPFAPFAIGARWLIRRRRPAPSRAESLPAART